MAETQEKHDYKSEFVKIYTDNITREGADKFLEYLKTSDFFDCPASTRFHSNFAGGLVEHSVRVYKRFVKLLESEYGEEYFKKQEHRESTAIIALLHDVCKIGCYKTEMRNVKQGDQWVKQPYYAYDDPLPYGHGEKSVYMISGYMRLTREEAMAINWHMGGWDARNSFNSSTVSSAFSQFPLAVLINAADLLATNLEERCVK